MKLINLKIALVWVFTAAIFLGFTSRNSFYIRGLKTVVLDAGHGGKDPGTGNGQWRGCRRLSRRSWPGAPAELSSPGYAVRLSRRSCLPHDMHCDGQKRTGQHEIWHRAGNMLDHGLKDPCAEAGQGY